MKELLGTLLKTCRLTQERQLLKGLGRTKTNNKPVRLQAQGVVVRNSKMICLHNLQIDWFVFLKFSPKIYEKLLPWFGTKENFCTSKCNREITKFTYVFVCACALYFLWYCHWGKSLICLPSGNKRGTMEWNTFAWWPDALFVSNASNDIQFTFFSLKMREKESWCFVFILHMHIQIYKPFLITVVDYLAKFLLSWLKTL